VKNLASQSRNLNLEDSTFLGSAERLIIGRNRLRKLSFAKDGLKSTTVALTTPVSTLYDPKPTIRSSEHYKVHSLSVGFSRHLSKRP